jgi:serine/threonine protein phosphatase 1
MSIYALSDLHGERKLWNQIKQFLKEDDIIIYLGDAVDRGPQPIQLLQELLNHDRVLFCLGNHEQCLIDAYEGIFTKQQLLVYFKDGGKVTWDAFQKLSKENQEKIINLLKKLPCEIIYKNQNLQTIHLSHAGYTPQKIRKKETYWDKYKRCVENRKHIYDIGWDWDKKENDIIVVHGHTPTGVINLEYSGKVLRYCDGHKIDIDIGATFCGVAALLDLDTLEPFYFYKEYFDLD